MGSGPGGQAIPQLSSPRRVQWPGRCTFRPAAPQRPSRAGAGRGPLLTGLGDGGADSAGHGKHSPMETPTPRAGNAGLRRGLQQAPPSSKLRPHLTRGKAPPRSKARPYLRRKTRPVAGTITSSTQPQVPPLSRPSASPSWNLPHLTRRQSSFIRSSIKSRLCHKSHPIRTKRTQPKGVSYEPQALLWQRSTHLREAPPHTFRPRPFQ